MGVTTMSCHAVAQPRDESLGTSYRTIAVVGPPNSGKTTLFNRLTKLRQKVGNFPGVTVEHHTGYVRDANGEEVALIDLPGVYSLTPKSEDEKVAVDVLTGKMPGTPAPDAVILVLNSTNLHTHLVLAARVIALGLPTLVLLNMADELRKQKGDVDVLSLARELGTPVALVSATTGEGLIAVQNFLASATASPEPLELPVVGSTRGYREWAVRVGQNANYRRPATPVWTARLDALFLHRLWGPIVFGLVVIGVFQVIFALGQPLSNLLQKFLDTTGLAIGNHLPAGMFQSLIVNGVWKGTGSVLVFLPQILLLFLVIGILEDSGYLSRAAVIADRTMSRVGLNGKSFIPLLSAYACAVPAIMATRTIESKRDRMATILIAPFMTCSARLPVYTMIIAAFLPNRALLGPFLGTRAAAMLGLYVIGFLMAVLTARLLKSTILKSKDAPFILEMPPYRWPTLASLGLRLVDRGKAFLYRAGTVIMLVSLLLWAATNFPMHNGQPPDGAEQRSGESWARHRAGYPSVGLRLENRRGLADIDCGARGHHRDPGNAARSRSGISRHRFTSRHAAGTHAGGRGSFADLLRLRHAMHVDDCRGASRNQWMEVADPAVYLHDRGRLPRGFRCL